MRLAQRKKIPFQNISSVSFVCSEGDWDAKEAAFPGPVKVHIDDSQVAVSVAMSITLIRSVGIASPTVSSCG